MKLKIRFTLQWQWDAFYLFSGLDWWSCERNFVPIPTWPWVLISKLWSPRHNSSTGCQQAVRYIDSLWSGLYSLLTEYLHGSVARQLRQVQISMVRKLNKFHHFTLLLWLHCALALTCLELLAMFFMPVGHPHFRFSVDGHGYPQFADELA